MVELGEKLQASESALQSFKDREQVLDLGSGDSVASQSLRLVNEKLSSAQAARFEAGLLAQQIREVEADSSRGLDSIPSIIAHPQMQSFNLAYQSALRRVNELSTRYGPKHPQMIAANSDLASARSSLDQQIELVADGLERDYQAALAAEQAAESEVERARRELREIDRQDFNLQALQREVDTNRQLFEKFQTQYKETDATGGVHTANARIVESARVPGSPVKPDKQRALLVAFFLGLIVSLGLAFLLEHLDNTLKGAHDVELRLDVAVLGLLPKLDTDGKKDLSPLRHFSEHQRTLFAESIRTVRTGVLLSALDHEHRVLLITSSVPGEGKTTLSMNLARALGEMKKVLLIDADMRRPTVAMAMGRAPDAPGLSHFIAGEAQVADCVTHIADTELYVMPAGIAPPNPLEMLSSHRFAHALEQLKEKFDHIVIDCAPALAVSDSMVLSKLATAVIYVIKSDATPIQAAQAGIKRLRRVGANIIGAVINQTALKTQNYYGKYSNYGDGYYSDYGYVVEDDKVA
jgi:capsular exopolysaccharide synthesis family protein